jgi:gliding motility-associated-like protein
MKEPLALVVNYDIDSPEFLWEGPDLDNSTEEFIITAISGDYQVTVTNSENGCSAVQVIQVFDNSTYIQSEIDIIQPLCFGDLPGIELTNNGGTEPYIFELMDAEGNPVFFDEVIAGTYDIHVIDYFGCDTSYTFTINEVFPFSIETGDSYTIVKGADAQLTADTDLEDEDIMEIIWSPSAPLSCNDCLNPTANGLTEDTWFTVNLIDKNGCVETDSILIRIIIEYEIYIPNVFTPDVDGNNDNFQIFSNIAGAEIEISDFRIYDRWGNRVHEEERFNLNSGGSWDGMHHDKPASQGVYAYTFKALYPEGNEEVFSGTITLIR